VDLPRKVELLKIVEIDLDRWGFKNCIAYLTSSIDITGCKLRIVPPPGARVVGVFPSWPEYMEEFLEWKIKAYRRIFEEEVKYSFGVRLDLEGRVDPGFFILSAWMVKPQGDELMKLVFDLAASFDFKLIVSPIQIHYNLDGSKTGILELSARKGVLQGEIVFKPVTPIVAGTVEAYIKDDILPFVVSLREVEEDIVLVEKYRLVLRLPDLVCLG